MKRLRILVLLVLAALLPFRGAVAEVLLCAGHAGQAAAAVDGHEAAAATHAGCEPAAMAADADDHGAAPDAGHHGAVVKCNTCTASCSMSPLLGTAPTVPAPLPLPQRHASLRDAPAPSHLTDGQERPPRSI
ncbi:hypothetical protein [Rubrivivax gelatinosus]|uniref:DUF2946 domain-containing protein n=1 Tax=Rubrivivax gelatinosus TaxID=28068 RepID=A0ABS1E000_RUBGE|nr:hypothetical protein [Rubrivivax gelatinosus]MBK1714934.1 hypothetical protein [Rubrivivax gelatinosus]